MLRDRYEPEDIFARVPQMAQRIDPVLKHLDVLLEDDELYEQVRSDFGKRSRYSLVHGRPSRPVEVILRMLLLKHLYAWSYQETEDEVDQNLILRWFCRLYWAAVPDDTTLIRWANTLKPQTLHALNDRVVELARQAKVTQGRKLRLDATCVQTEIHHPTDSGLLVDSVRVLALRQGGQGTGCRADALGGAACRSRLRSANESHNSCIGNCDAKARTKRPSRKALPEAGGDHRAHRAAGDTCGGGAGPADGTAGHPTAHPG